MFKPKIQGVVYVYQLLDICADRDVCPLLFGKPTKCPQFWLNCTREQYSHCMQCHLKIDTERLDSHFMDCRKVVLYYLLANTRCFIALVLLYNGHHFAKVKVCIPKIVSPCDQEKTKSYCSGCSSIMCGSFPWFQLLVKPLTFARGIVDFTNKFVIQSVLNVGQEKHPCQQEEHMFFSRSLLLELHICI